MILFPAIDLKGGQCVRLIKGDMAQEPSGAQQIKKGWTEDELKQFDRLRRRVVVRG